eukprot:5331686-Prymnesium_polylepis.1
MYALGPSAAEGSASENWAAAAEPGPPRCAMAASTSPTPCVMVVRRPGLINGLHELIRAP